MNNNEINDFYAFCDERELSRPCEVLLRQRLWTWLLHYSFTNLSIDRWMIFGALSEYMSKEEYCQTLRWLWSHSEGDIESVGVEACFTTHNGVDLNISDFLTSEELHIYESWSQTITIYRGCTDETREGLSWTEHYEIARSFAEMRAHESPTETALVLTAEYDKANILCYILNGLNEYEVLVRPFQISPTDEEIIN